MKPSILNKIGGRLTHYQEKYRRAHVPAPSFRAKLAERKRVADRVRLLRGVAGGPIYSIETKLGQKEIANKAGVETAAILQGPVDTLQQFNLRALPDKFVIKPIIGSGSNGVFLLEKQGAQLKELSSSKTFPMDLSSLHSAGLAKFEGCPLIAEELVELGNRPAMDWKVYAFYDQIGFIRQMVAVEGEKRHKLWSPEGDALGKIDYPKVHYDPDLPPPEDLNALLSAAKSISKVTRSPFVRVDLYEADDGVRMGEITLRPGSMWRSTTLQFHTPEWDRKLGEMWEEAQARLIEQLGETYIP